MGVGAIGGFGGYDYAGLASAAGRVSGGGSVAEVLVDSLNLESEMALKLVQANAQQQVAVQQMEFTQQIVDMYV